MTFRKQLKLKFEPGIGANKKSFGRFYAGFDAIGMKEIL